MDTQRRRVFYCDRGPFCCPSLLGACYERRRRFSGRWRFQTIQYPSTIGRIVAVYLSFAHVPPTFYYYHHYFQPSFSPFLFLSSHSTTLMPRTGHHIDPPLSLYFTPSFPSLLLFLCPHSAIHFTDSLTLHYHHYHHSASHPVLSYPYSLFTSSCNQKKNTFCQ